MIDKISLISNIPKWEREVFIDKEYALAIVNRRGLDLEYLPSRFKNDKDVVAEAVNQNPQAYKFAEVKDSVSIKDNDYNDIFEFTLRNY